MQVNNCMFYFRYQLIIRISLFCLSSKTAHTHNVHKHRDTCAFSHNLVLTSAPYSYCPGWRCLQLGVRLGYDWDGGRVH